MTRDIENPATVASVARTIDILWLCDTVRGIKLTKLAGTLELPKSSVYRHLKTLEQSGFVIRKGNGYYLKLRFLYFGNIARKRWDPQEILRESTRYVADQTKERVQFMVWEHDAVVYLYREFSDRTVQTDTIVRKRMPVHATLGGKSILACLPERKREKFLNGYILESYTNHTITDRDTLSEELRTIQREGIAVNRQEYIDGL